MANAERLLDVLTFLEEHPERHDQEVWIGDAGCGTVACLAGWTCLRNGYVEKITESSLTGTVHWGVYLDSDPTGFPTPVLEVAMDILELSYEDAHQIFDGDNTLEVLWEIADEITDGEVSRLRAEDAERGRSEVAVTP